MTTIGMKLPPDEIDVKEWQPQSRRLWGWSIATEAGQAHTEL